MAKEQRNLNGLILWSVPLLLVLLLISLSTSGSTSRPRNSSRTQPFTIAAPPHAQLNENVVVGTLTNLNPQLMIPLPHPGRWYLRTSNSLSADLVCPTFRMTIDQAFVESSGESCQVVLVALHLPVETKWRLAAG